MQNKYRDHISGNVPFMEVSSSFKAKLKEENVTQVMIDFLSYLPEESQDYGAAYLGNEKWVTSFSDYWKKNIFPIGCGHSGNSLFCYETEDENIEYVYVEDMSLGEDIDTTARHFFESHGKSLFDKILTFEVELF